MRYKLKRKPPGYTFCICFNLKGWGCWKINWCFKIFCQRIYWNNFCVCPHHHKVLWTLSQRFYDTLRLSSECKQKERKVILGGGLCHTACGILVPQPGIEPVPAALEAQSTNRGVTKEVPKGNTFLNKSQRFSFWEESALWQVANILVLTSGLWVPASLSIISSEIRFTQARQRWE